MSIIKSSEKPVNIISVGITWLHGAALFKHDTKHSKCYFGICNFSGGVFAVTPIDWPRLKMLTTIRVSPTESYCERAYSCLNFICHLNRFDKHIFADEFKDCGLFTLGLSKNVSKETPLWFSVGEYKSFWSKFVLPITGGIIEYDSKEAERVLNE